MAIQLTHHNRILCSTGALIGRPNGRDFTLLGPCTQKLTCDGFEFMMYNSWYDQQDALRRCIAALGLSIPVFHAEKSIGEYISRNEDGDTDTALARFKINCMLAKDFGANLLVLHLWNGIHSDKNIAHNIALYPYLRDIADRYNLILTVENVVCNHADPMTHLLALKDAYPDITFTFDTKMAAFHGQLPLLYQKKNRHLLQNIRHFHINDYGGGYMDWQNLRTLPIGAGHIDFASLFAFLHENEYCGAMTVEATAFDEQGVIHHDILNNSFEIIRNHIRTTMEETKP